MVGPAGLEPAACRLWVVDHLSERARQISTCRVYERFRTRSLQRYPPEGHQQEFVESRVARLAKIFQTDRHGGICGKWLARGGAEQVVEQRQECAVIAVCELPVLAMLDEAYGLDHALLTTLHSVMNDQPLIDGYHHSDLHRTRSAMQSMIPVSTGLARGVVRLLPELAGRVEAKAIRVPVVNVSAIDLVVTLCRQTSVEEVNALLRAAADGHDSGRMSYTAAPHASIDFNHSVHSAIVDAGQTRMSGGRLLNLLIWFDNEWGFANRMLDVAAFWGERMR